MCLWKEISVPPVGSRGGGINTEVGTGSGTSGICEAGVGTDARFKVQSC